MKLFNHYMKTKSSKTRESEETHRLCIKKMPSNISYGSFRSKTLKNDFRNFNYFQEYLWLQNVHYHLVNKGNEIWFLKQMKYLKMLKGLHFNCHEPSSLKNQFLASLYFMVLERKSIDITIKKADEHAYNSQTKESMETSGYFMSLLMLQARSKLIIDTDKQTSLIFMKRLFTADDVRSRTDLREKSLILSGYCHDEPIERFDNYNSLSEHIKINFPQEYLKYDPRVYANSNLRH